MHNSDSSFSIAVYLLFFFFFGSQIFHLKDLFGVLYSISSGHSFVPTNYIVVIYCWNHVGLCFLSPNLWHNMLFSSDSAGILIPDSFSIYSGLGEVQQRNNRGKVSFIYLIIQITCDVVQSIHIPMRESPFYTPTTSPFP